MGEKKMVSSRIVDKTKEERSNRLIRCDKDTKMTERKWMKEEKWVFRFKL